MIESCVCSFSDSTLLHLMRIRFLHFCARGATFPRALMQHFPVHLFMFDATLARAYMFLCNYV